MSGAEIHRRENLAAATLGEKLEKAGLDLLPGGWLEGTLIDSRFEVEASQVFSEWLSEVVSNPSGQKPEEYLESLKTALAPYVVGFQDKRRTHDFLKKMLPKQREGDDSNDID